MKHLLVIALLAVGTASWADRLVTSRSANIKSEPSSGAETVERINSGVSLALLDDGQQTAGYYKVMSPGGEEGWIYRTLVRRFADNGESEGGGVNAALTLGGILPTTQQGDVLVKHPGYTSCMSTEYTVPRWVAHQLSNDLLQGTAKREGSSYPKDSAFPGLKGNAYASSGYDHGHLAPAADFKKSQEQTDESFLMTNMTPQHGCMNQKGWCVLESNVRQWARRAPDSKFFIFSGPVLTDFIDTLCIDNSTTVYVPAQFYKVVVEQTKAGQLRGCGFLVANGLVEFNDLEGGRVSIDDVESLTGIDFMSSLPASRETALERTPYAFALQNLPECGNKSCEAVYSKRKLPEEREKLLCE